MWSGISASHLFCSIDVAVVWVFFSIEQILLLKSVDEINISSILFIVWVNLNHGSVGLHCNSINYDTINYIILMVICNRWCSTASAAFTESSKSSSKWLFERWIQAWCQFFFSNRHGIEIGTEKNLQNTS